MEIEKYCPRCNVYKPGTDFYKVKHTSDGLAGYCKECFRKTTQEYMSTHPDRAQAYKDKYTEKRKMLSKEYNQRPEVKAKNKIRYATPDYKQKAHERYLEHRETRLAYEKKYREKNLEKVKEMNRDYRRRNIDKVREQRARYARTSPVAKKQRAEYRKRRLQNDPVFALKERMRKTMSSSFLRRGYKKNSPTQQILGCDWPIFVKHLFKTWENRYGDVYAGEDYHIDHIIPLAMAKTEQEVRDLCHYTNLQLLKPEDNLAKSSKLVES